MGEAHEHTLKIEGHEAKEASPPENANVNHHSTVPKLRQYKWWIQMVIFSLLVLSAQSAATLLGRLYFDKGAKSKWMATLVQTAGFPILIPFLFFSPTKHGIAQSNQTTPPSTLILVSFYTFLGLFLAAFCMLYTIGLQYLPVSTYSLISASQLGFNAIFSYFLNAQKFTPFIVNSLVLLTISSTLLVFQNDDSGDSNKTSKGKYTIGFMCTVAASAGYALNLSITQLAFRKILKRETFRVVMDVIIYQSLVATCVILVGLFSSGEWRNLRREMKEYELGNLSYVMNLVWIAVIWQVFSIGATGLIFKVSSLFSNVISTLGLPIVPVLAVFIFQDKMSGLKVVAMLLAIWGFASYIYQHYLDDLELKARSRIVNEVSLVERA
ncbi:unnamed protein product [Ilex paraguariensis]|uniref:Probable purine permease n=1 Tax=Ilex paraguariensis TaxID=185542 RepID=A0ABC8RQ76_9AQUA